MPSTTSSAGSKRSVITLPVPGLERLIERLGLDLEPDLLAPALVHRSWCAEHAGHPSNERLEFLGDSVLGVVVTDHVYRTHDDLPEGDLTEIRKTVVNSVALAEVADGLKIGEHLLQHARVSIGPEKGPRIGAERGPLFSTVVADPTRRSRSGLRRRIGSAGVEGQARFLKRQLSLPVSTISQ